MTGTSRFKKPLLYALIASVIFGAGFGIFVVLRNEWSWFEVRVMLTTTVIAAASLCGLACDLSRIPAGHNVLPRVGLVLTGIAATLLLIGIWPEIESEVYWKTTLVFCIFAVATVHVCLLSIARLTGRFQIVYQLSCQIIYGFALLLATMAVGELVADGLWRFVAALSIVVAALTLIIPILHRIQRISARQDELLSPLEQRNIASIDEEIGRLKERIKRLEAMRSQMAGQPETHPPSPSSVPHSC